MIGEYRVSLKRKGKWVGILRTQDRSQADYVVSQYKLVRWFNVRADDNTLYRVYQCEEM